MLKILSFYLIYKAIIETGFKRHYALLFRELSNNEAKLREEFRPVSENLVKGMLILGEIAKQNDLTISEEDESEGFKMKAASMGHDPETLRKYYEANNLMDSFRHTLLKEKTLNFLVDNAKVTEVDADKIRDI